jgi:hypothetical protein
MCVSDGNGYIQLSNDIFTFMNNLFMENELNLNSDKTNFMKFVCNMKPLTDMNKCYYDKSVEETKTTKFLGFQIELN